jgi:hypothetical protein
MSGKPQSPRKHRAIVRLFVGAHLLGAAAIYGIALAVGGGFAEPPFPPEAVRFISRPGFPSAPPAEGRNTSWTDDGLPAAFQRVEVDPPWFYDLQVRPQRESR